MTQAFTMTPKAFSKVRNVILLLDKPSTATFIFKQSKQNFFAIKRILSILVKKKEILCIETSTDNFYYPLNKTKLAKTLNEMQNIIEKERLKKQNDKYE